MSLDFSALPSGTGWGGPEPLRAVAVADQLGTGAVRVQLDWPTLLKHGPEAAVDVSAYVEPLRTAALEARRRGVTFVVQVGQGGIEKGLVENGTWERRVEEVVRGLKGLVPAWEAWNEPNATYGPPSAYVTNVLAPFARAVRRADPSAVVVGGSTVGVSVGYWKGIVAADGLRWLDVAAIHPYTGHNRSWEEDGTISQLRALRDLLKRDGVPIPIWNTEHAWWSNGPANLLRQADNSARAVLWMRAFGIDRWAYFIPEGGWGDHGASFSAIQLDSFVKPAALAIMTAENQVAGRPFLGEVDMGFPSAYALRFGPRAGDANSGELIAAWTDSVRLPVVVSSGADRAVRLTRALGAVHQLTVGDGTQLMLDSDPVYSRGTGSGQAAATGSGNSRRQPGTAIGWRDRRCFLRECDEPSSRRSRRNGSRKQRWRAPGAPDVGVGSRRFTDLRSL